MRVIVIGDYTCHRVTKPHPPIYIGGGGKRVLSIAAREADYVGLTARSTARGIDWTSATHEATMEKVAWLRDEAGERFSLGYLSSSLCGQKTGKR